MDDTEEDVANLVFPPEIPKNTWILFHGEVACLLLRQKDTFQQKGRPIPPVLESTLEYVKRFSTMKNVDDAQAEQLLTSLRGTLQTTGDYSQQGDTTYKRKLHGYEMAALANMFLNTASDDPVDEARALIPSLKRTEDLGDRFTDDEIESIVSTVRNFNTGVGNPIEEGDF